MLFSVCVFLTVKIEWRCLSNRLIFFKISIYIVGTLKKDFHSLPKKQKNRELIDSEMKLDMSYNKWKNNGGFCERECWGSSYSLVCTKSSQCVSQAYCCLPQVKKTNSFSSTGKGVEWKFQVFDTDCQSFCSLNNKAASLPCCSHACESLCFTLAGKQFALKVSHLSWAVS